ncbi:MAG: hypothetical protein A2Y38_15620 [Spirochaetes bacterium GWB1_59_5]|nr:MAG: hypothetical protein A2Y38_15620 [Spirochaetes bacterium GWB1_59_5]
MKNVLLMVLCLIPALVWAGDFAPNPVHSRTLSLGTKGFANYSVAYRDGVKFKAATAAGVATTVKVFFDDDETHVYPSSGENIDRGKLTKVGFRAYSSATPVTVHVWGR